MSLIPKIIESLYEQNIILNLIDSGIEPVHLKGLAIDSSIIAMIRENEADLMRFLSSQQKFPLSVNQEQLWLAVQKSGNPSAYNVPLLLELPPAIDIECFIKALHSVIQKHPALRTRFLSDNGIVQQVFDAHIYVEKKNLLLKSGFDSYVRTYINEPFDLSMSICKFILINDDSTHSNKLLMVLHHLIVDGFSFNIILREISEYYTYFENNIPDDYNLNHTESNYLHYLRWQLVYRKSKSYQKGLEFWKQYLQSAEYYSFPNLMSNSESKSTQKSVEIHFSQDTHHKLRLVSKKNCCGFHAIFSAVLGLQLAANSYSDDVTIGMPIFNRPYVLWQRIVAYLSNTVTLRFKLDSELTIEEYIKQVQSDIFDIFEYSGVVLSDILDILPRSSLKARGIFSVLLVYKNLDDEINRKCVLRGNVVETTMLDVDASKYDIIFNLIEQNKCLKLKIDYDIEKYELTYIENLSNEYRCVLEQFITDQSQKISDILFSSPEKTTAYKKLNQSSTVVKKPLLQQCLAEAFSCHSSKVAVIDGKHLITYSELEYFSRVISSKLASYKFSCSSDATIVAITTDNLINFVIAITACIRLNLSYLPISHKQSNEYTFNVLEDAKPMLLLSTAFDEKADYDYVPDSIDQYTVIAWLKNDLAPPFVNWDNLINQNGLLPAYVIYTSGTTGKPKGVLVSQQAIVDLVYKNEFFPIQESDVVAQASDLAFDASTYEIWGPLLNGGICNRVATNLFANSKKLKEFIVSSKIVYFFVTTSLFEVVITNDPTVFDSVKHVYFGGEKIAPSTVKSYFSVMHPKTSIYNVYGPTEAVTFTTIYPVTHSDIDEPSILIGRSIQNRYCYNITKFNSLAPICALGELCIGGSISDGYLYDERKTKLKFVRLPFAHDLVYRTGDLVQLRKDGNLIFHGRFDAEAKVNGYRINLNAIKDAILEIDFVENAIVQIIKENEHVKILSAYIKLTPSALSKYVAHIDLIKQTLIAQLPHYMLPKRYFLINTVPYTKNSKIDYTLLHEKAVQVKSEVIFEALNPVEKLILKIWKSILGGGVLQPADDVFSAGASSLQSIQFIQELYQKTGKFIDLVDLFSHRSIEQQAQLLESLEIHDLDFQNDTNNLYAPLLPIQKQIYYEHFVSMPKSTYNVPCCITFHGKVAVKYLPDVINTLINSIDVFNLSFNYNAQEIVQKIDESSKAEVNIIEHCETDNVDALFQSEVTHVFDLSAAPLVRFTIVKMTENEIVLLIVAHHIILDGYSLNLIIQNIYKQMEVRSSGKTSSFSNIATSFLDYCNQYHDKFSLNLKADAKYWSGVWRSVQEKTEVFFRNRQPAQGNHGHVFKVEIPNRITKQFLLLMSAHKISLYDCYLIAFVLTMMDIKQRKNIIIGTPLSGRHFPGVNDTIGCFVNSIPLVFDMQEACNLQAVIDTTTQTVREAMQHQSLPFSEILKRLPPELQRLGNGLLDAWFFIHDVRDYLYQGEIFKTTYNDVPTYTSKFPLALGIMLDESGSYLRFEYNHEYYSKTQIQDIADNYIDVMDGIIDGRYNNTLDIEQQIKEPIDAKSHPLNYFLQAVNKQPDAFALVFNRKSYTYLQLNEYSDNFASKLLTEKKNWHDEVIPMAIEQIDLQIIAMLAIMKLGAVYFPLSSNADKVYLKKYYQRYNASILLTDKLSFTTCGDINVQYINRKFYKYSEKEKKPFDYQFNQRLYLINTSGTTGDAKGVIGRAKSIVNLIEHMTSEAPLPNGGNFILWTKLMFDVSIYEIWSAFASAGLIHCLNDTIRLVPTEFFEYLYQKKIRSAYIPPYMLPHFSKWLSDKSIKLSLKRLLIGVEPVSYELALEIISMVPDLIIINGYGPTEASVCCTTFTITSETTNPQQLSQLPIGKMISHSDCYVLDEELNPVPDGQEGLLYVTGRCLSYGYYGMEKEVDAMFPTNSFDIAGKLYNTGDRVKTLTDGNMLFIGRNDRQVKLHGHRINLLQVEHAIMSHPEVINACALVIEDKQQKLIAFITSNNHEINVSELKDFISPLLEVYMIPSAIYQIDQLPITENGKVNNQELIAKYGFLGRGLL